MSRKIFSIDRAEGTAFVCISDDDDKVTVDKARLSNLKVNDVFSAELDGEEISDIIPMPDERDRRLAKSRARLHALSKKNKQ